MSAVLRKNEVVLGVDFDNTLISYDALAHTLAKEQGLIPLHFPKHKQKIRDHIRQNSGDEKWQEIQAVMYGERIHEAALSPQVDIFLEECHNRKIPVYIVSHKTEVSNLLRGGANFRQAALNWMENQHFFTRFGLLRENVHFASTRDEKVKKIQELHCTHFIDDLEEVFGEHDFPRGVKKILYHPIPHEASEPKSRSFHSDHSMLSMNSWREIYDYFFS